MWLRTANQTHHPFTTEGVPPPEPEGLVTGSKKVQPRASSIPVPQKAPPTAYGGASSSSASRVPHEVPPTVPPRPDRPGAPEVTADQGAASSAHHLPHFGKPQVAPVGGRLSTRLHQYCQLGEHLRSGPGQTSSVHHTEHVPRNAFHAWQTAQWQEQQARGRSGSQPPPEPSNPPPRHHHKAASTSWPTEIGTGCWTVVGTVGIGHFTRQPVQHS